MFNGNGNYDGKFCHSNPVTLPCYGWDRLQLAPVTLILLLDYSH